MGDTLEYVQAARVKRQTITIPGSGGTAATLESLATGLSATEKAQAIGCKVLGVAADGSSRLAFLAGDSTTSLLQYVGLGADYAEPAASDLANTYVRAVAAAEISNAILVTYLRVSA